jgi:hypothetical protein
MDGSSPHKPLGIVLVVAIGAGSAFADHHQPWTDTAHTPSEAPRDSTIRSPAALVGSNLIASGPTLGLLARAAARYFAE